MIPIAVYDETSDLIAVTSWQIGIEAFVGHTLPQEKSLYEAYFDVQEVMKKQKNIVNILSQQMGIKVVDLRDSYARSLPTSTEIKKEQLVKTIEDQCRRNIRDNWSYIEGETVKKLLEEGIIGKLLEEDIKVYGEDRAVNLNYELCAKHPSYPLCNIFYVRDIFSVVLDKVISSRMRRRIRQPEVSLIETALKPFVKKISRIPQGNLEGGDVIVFDDKVYVGTGRRTDECGASELFNILRETSVSSVYEFIVIKQPWNIMHSDTFWMPWGTGTVVVEPNVAKETEVMSFPKNQSRNYKPSDLRSHGDFYTYLGDRYEIIKIDHIGQLSGQSNFLNLTEKDKIFTGWPTQRFSKKIDLDGIKPVGHMSFYDSTGAGGLRGGGGAAHCSFNALARGYVH